MPEQPRRRRNARAPFLRKESNMKKRLRKKLHLGEFTDRLFTMTAKVTGVTDINSENFYIFFTEVSK